MVDGVRSALIRLVAPGRCAFCSAATAAGSTCAGCHDALPWNRIACPICALPQALRSQVCARCSAEAPAYDSAWSAFRYEAPIAQAIHGLKYREQLRHARLLAAAMAEAIARRPAVLPDLLLPVPLHVKRLRSRGYNQALELARGIARHLAVEVDFRSASRTRETRDQIGQDAGQRRRAVKDAFSVDRAVAGRHVAIVDDVMTTGSTVDELARACRRAGAATIEVWTAARAV